MAHLVRFLGHAAFEVVSGGGKRILIDPWITGNPACPVQKEDLKSPNLILISHDHFDHLGEDVPALVKDSEAVIVAQPELIRKLTENGITDANVMGMNIGGTIEIAGIKTTMVQAFHSSSVGTPCGYIVTMEDGKRLYHAGDTGIFADMEILGELYPLDLALLPIGSVFVMDPVQAAHALKLLKPKIAVPMHYKTFPILVQDADHFIKLAREKVPAVEIRVLEPGQTTKF